MLRGRVYFVNEIYFCFCYSCIFFYRVFKHSDLFLWLGKAITTCYARLVAGTLAIAVHKLLIGLWLFSRVWFACSGKDL